MMFFVILALILAAAILGMIVWQDKQTIRQLKSATQLRPITPDYGHNETVVTIPALEQLQRALPGSLWIISVPHTHEGHLVYTVLMKEPTTTDEQLQIWAAKNAKPLNPLDPKHHKAWRRLVNIVFGKVKDGTQLNWGDALLIKIGYKHHMPYPDIEQAYRDFVSGTMRDPSSSGTLDGLRALRDSAQQATLRKTHFDLPAFKEITVS